MPSDYMICTGWCGNGVLILGIIIIMAHLAMEALGKSGVIFIGGYYVAVLGVLVQSFVVVLAVVGMSLMVV